MAFLFCAAVIDIVEKLLDPKIAAHLRLLILAELDRTQRREVLSVLRHFDQLLGSRALRNLNLFAPSTYAECFACQASRMPRIESVRPAQAEKNVWTQRMSARQHGLRFCSTIGLPKERCHQFIWRSASLLQTVDVGPRQRRRIFPATLMQLYPVIALIRKFRRMESSAWR